LPCISESFVLPEKINIRVYRSVILSVVLYGCEIWSVTLREEHRLKAFENRVLRRIFGCKKYEVKGWRGLHMRTFIIHGLHHIL
jgi:hypothetical protein